MTNLFQFFLSLVLIYSLHILEANSTRNSCAAYCDSENIKVKGFDCDEKYCCGNETYRECCDNATLDISEEYPDDVTICSRHRWLFYQWQLLLGSMGIMILLIIITACCCQCHTIKSGGWQRAAQRRRRQSHRSSRTRTELSIIDVPEPSQPTFFDPSHPYAFEPPGYESLPKDPPTYNEVCGLSEADNPAFSEDTTPCSSSTTTQENPPPPVYQEVLPTGHRRSILSVSPDSSAQPITARVGSEHEHRQQSENNRDESQRQDRQEQERREQAATRRREQQDGQQNQRQTPNTQPDFCSSEAQYSRQSQNYSDRMEQGHQVQERQQNSILRNPGHGHGDNMPNSGCSHGDDVPHGSGSASELTNGEDLSTTVQHSTAPVSETHEEYGRFSPAARAACRPWRCPSLPPQDRAVPDVNQPCVDNLTSEGNIPESRRPAAMSRSSSLLLSASGAVVSHRTHGNTSSNRESSQHSPMVHIEMAKDTAINI